MDVNMLELGSRQTNRAVATLLFAALQFIQITQDTDEQHREMLKYTDTCRQVVFPEHIVDNHIILG
jgi:hypothetical protein